jgi:hypothetical protein
MSEVARLLRQIDQERQSAQWALTGLTYGTARHDFITRKVENIQQAHESLIKLVGPEKAIELVTATLEKHIYE